MSGITTEFDEEAESAIESAPKTLKRYLFDLFSVFFLFFFFSSPHRFIPPSVPFREVQVAADLQRRVERIDRIQQRIAELHRHAQRAVYDGEDPLAWELEGGEMMAPPPLAPGL